MPTRARDQRSKAVVTNVAHFLYLVIYRVVGKTLACVYPAQTAYTSAVENSIAIALVSYGSMWIRMKTQLAQNVRERARYNI